MPGKSAAEGIKPGISRTHNDHQSQKPHVRQFTPTSVKDPLRTSAFTSPAVRAIQNIYNKLLSFWRHISQPKSIVTLSTQTFRMSFEKACLSAVISSILMVLYGVLSSGTFPKCGTTSIPAPSLAYECAVTCGEGSVRSSLSPNFFHGAQVDKEKQLVVGRNQNRENQTT